MLSRGRIASAVACMAALSGCSSISTDIHSAKTDAINAGLREARQEIRELRRRVETEQGHRSGTGSAAALIKAMHLRRPNGVSEREWRAALRKGINGLAGASSAQKP